MGAPAGMDGNLRHGPRAKEVSRARLRRAIRGCAHSGRTHGYYRTGLARAAGAFGAEMGALVQWHALVPSPEFEIDERSPQHLDLAHKDHRVARPGRAGRGVPLLSPVSHVQGQRTHP